MFPTPNWNNHASKVEYTISTLQAIVSAKPDGLSDKTHEHPNFSTLWHLQRKLVDGLHKIGNVKLPMDSHTGYILSKEAFNLLSSKEWIYPEKVGEYYEIPVTAITETEQRTKEKMEIQKIE